MTTEREPLTRGRHRRPKNSQSTVLLRGATVTSAAFALPLTAVSTSHAAPAAAPKHVTTQVPNQASSQANTQAGTLADTGQQSVAPATARPGSTGHVTVTKNASASRSTQRTYEVRSGDTLFAIAQRFQVAGGWQRLYRANRSVVGSDPDVITPGMRLRIPSGAAGHSGSGSKASSTSSGSGKSDSSGSSSSSGKSDSSGSSSGSGKSSSSGSSSSSGKSGGGSGSGKGSSSSSHGKSRHASRSSGSRSHGAVHPVTGYTISARYHQSGSWSSGHHTGVDLAVPSGTTVRAAIGGTVVRAGWQGAYGWAVLLRHADGRYSLYGHMSHLGVHAGDSVNTGQKLGSSGATGNVTGPHLHFEVRSSPSYGSDVNPVSWLAKHGVKI